MDIVASKLPSGAGRFQDFSWPDPMAGSSVGAAVRPRNSSQALAAVPPGTQLFVGAPLASVAAVVAGVSCQQLVSTATQGQQKVVYPGFPVLLRTSKSLISPLVDDTSVYRIVIAMCRNGAAVAAGRDFGVQLAPWRGAILSRVVADNLPGIALRLQSTNVVQLIINGPNGLVITDLTAAPFTTDLTWHSFDCRFFSATEHVGARWALQIDGTPVDLAPILSDWDDPNSYLPPIPLTGAHVGFAPAIVGDAGANAGLFVANMHLMCAPNELNCL